MSPQQPRPQPCKEEELRFRSAGLQLPPAPLLHLSSALAEAGFLYISGFQTLARMAITWRPPELTDYASAHRVSESVCLGEGVEILPF